MAISETSRKIYEGISSILAEHGQGFTKSQAYAVENLLQTVEESVEKRCCTLAESILDKKDRQCQEKIASAPVSDTTIEKVNEMVERRVTQLKKEIPQIVDYAKMKRMSECMEAIKECVGYKCDEQVARLASENAKALSTTKTLIDAQAKQIAGKAKTISEKDGQIKKLSEMVESLKKSVSMKDKLIADGANKTKELCQSIHSLQKKIDESRKLNESIEEKRRSESLRYYLESRISKYPTYEASELRNRFRGAKSRAEIDEHFDSALAEIRGKMSDMRKVSAIPVAKVEVAAKPATMTERNKKTISGGETIVGEGVETPSIYAMEDLENDDMSCVEETLDDSDTIDQNQMALWISRL